MEPVQIENEYETPIEPNYYQNNHKNLQNPDNIYQIIDYTEQELKESVYQNASNKIQLPKEKVWTILLLLESPKNKDFQLPDLKTDFLID